LKEPYLEKIFKLKKTGIIVISDMEFEYCVLCGRCVVKAYTYWPPAEIQTPYVTIDSPYKKLGIGSWNFPPRFNVCNECFRRYQGNLETAIISKTLPYAIERLKEDLEIVRRNKAEIIEELQEVEREEHLLMDSLNKLQNLESK
jgi:hypothetical protein